MAQGPLRMLVQRIQRLVGGPAAEEAGDRALLARFAARKEEAAFATLVERHGPMVLAVCRRMLRDDYAADDAFQATFLLLAQKAGAAGWQDSIAGWLHQAASRVSAKARVRAARRRAHESKVRPMNPAPADSAPGPDFRNVLDEELARLPEKYRVPLVLCHLEGKTTDQAAELLGWPRGTVAGRLARAKDLLRERLTRRGLALSSATFASLLAAETAHAGVTTTLAEAAVRTAVAWISGTAAAAGIAEPVAALTREVARDMFIFKVKVAAVAVTVFAMAGAGLGWVAYQAFGAENGATVAVQNGQNDPTQPKPPAEKPTVRKLKTPQDPTDPIVQEAGQGVSVFENAKALEPLGGFTAKALADQVDFKKEKIVRVGYSTGGPPFGVLMHEFKEEGGKPVILFYVQEPKAGVPRGRALMLGNDYFAVSPNATVKFGGLR